jgi:hypothetical protein
LSTQEDPFRNERRHRCDKVEEFVHACCSKSERIKRIGLFNIMKEHKDLGEPRPKMLPSEKSRNFELRGQIEEGKILLSQKLERLFSELWQDHHRVSLIALEDLVQVHHPPVESKITNICHNKLLH